MGYTHYFTRPTKNAGSAYMFGKLALDAKKICEYANQNGIRVRDAFGNNEPNFTEFDFSINGDAEAGEDYETFYWAGIPEHPPARKNDSEFFDFCKTNSRPYDAVVTAILIRAKVIYGSCVNVSSDGNWQEWESGKVGKWESGRTLYESVFGEEAICPFSQ